MTPADRLERDLPDLLAEVVVPAPSADLTATLERIAVVRQRPAWTLLERWIPLDITDQSLTLRGRAPALRPIVLVVIMALVILAGFLLYVGSRPRFPRLSVLPATVSSSSRRIPTSTSSRSTRRPARSQP